MIEPSRDRSSAKTLAPQLPTITRPKKFPRIDATSPPRDYTASMSLDVLTLIFSFLPGRACIRVLSYVNKRWCRAVIASIVTIDVRPLVKIPPVETLIRFHALTALSFSLPHSESLLTVLPSTLRHLTVSQVDWSPDCHDIHYAHLSNLTSLDIHLCFVCRCRDLIARNAPSLTVLSLHDSADQLIDSNYLAVFSFPKLHTFKFNAPFRASNQCLPVLQSARMTLTSLKLRYFRPESIHNALMIGLPELTSLNVRKKCLIDSACIDIIAFQVPKLRELVINPFTDTSLIPRIAHLLRLRQYTDSVLFSEFHNSLELCTALTSLEYLMTIIPTDNQWLYDLGTQLHCLALQPVSLLLPFHRFTNLHYLHLQDVPFDHAQPTPDLFALPSLEQLHLHVQGVNLHTLQEPLRMLVSIINGCPRLQVILVAYSHSHAFSATETSDFYDFHFWAEKRGLRKIEWEPENNYWRMRKELTAKLKWLSLRAGRDEL